MNVGIDKELWLKLGLRGNEVEALRTRGVNALVIVSISHIDGSNIYGVPDVLKGMARQCRCGGHHNYHTSVYLASTIDVSLIPLMRQEWSPF